jgi:hypothetical protein
LALPAGMATAFFPVSHKYTSLLLGVLVLMRFPFSRALYAVAADKFGATVPLWHPLKAQLFIKIGWISFEKLTVVFITGVLSILTVSFLVQLTITRMDEASRIIPIAIVFFDMIFLF